MIDNTDIVTQALETARTPVSLELPRWQWHQAINALRNEAKRERATAKRCRWASSKAVANKRADSFEETAERLRKQLVAS